MTSDRQDLLLHREDAWTIVERLNDRTTYQLLAMAYTQVALTIGQQRSVPESAFDLLFYVRVMKRICERHEELSSILFLVEDHQVDKEPRN